MDAFNEFLASTSNLLYSYILIILLVGTGIYFFIRTKALPFRMFAESIRVVAEPPSDEDSISSFRALMVSTASRVGVGNIAGVATAIATGGAGAMFWMWLIATLGGSSAFIESTLAQIYKKRDTDGSSYGGPAFYIQQALKSRWLGMTFAVILILTYMGGFNMLASFNTADSFRTYSFFDESWTPAVIGLALAIATGLSIIKGTKRLSLVTSYIVPVMAIIYIIGGLLVIFSNLGRVPEVFSAIFSQAFDFEAIFGGFAGSAVMLGIKRGLYSNEAGIGSAPNAAASAGVSHPVKQGLVQMLSVFIDTMIICTITGLTILMSGVQGGEDLTGAALVQESLSTVMGPFGHPFLTFALVLFAFTTLIGNFYYAEVNLRYIMGRTPSNAVLYAFRITASVIVFAGALLALETAWNIADILMGLMALINLPVIIILGKKALLALQDYQQQRKAGVNPEFKASTIELDGKVDFWQ